MKKNILFWMGTLLMLSFGMISCSNDDETNTNNVYSAQIIGPYKTGDIIMASITEIPSDTPISKGNVIAFAASDLPHQKLNDGTVVSFRIKEFHEGGIQTTEYLYVNYFCVVEPI